LPEGRYGKYNIKKFEIDETLYDDVIGRVKQSGVPVYSRKRMTGLNNVKYFMFKDGLLTTE
jgi:hypothetical protein